MDDLGQVHQWNEKYLVIGELSSSYLENSWDIGNPEFLKTMIQFPPEMVEN